MQTRLRAAGTGLVGLVVLGLLLFAPAGTLDYWQAWIFIAVFTLSTSVPSIYLALKDPAALERRMHFGPAAETRAVQRCIASIALVSLPTVIVFSAFDHRFGWSPVPAAISVVGDALVLLGLGVSMLVVIQNRYAASNITVEADQKVISTGLYGLVRHPMYVGALILMTGIPLSLDSRWGLLVLLPAIVGLVFGILDEEKMLEQQLPGYGEYKRKVRYRLLPFVW